MAGPLFGAAQQHAPAAGSGPLFGNVGQTFGDKLSGFTLSALESFPELFGIETTRATQEFRAQNPVSGFLSQAVGAFVPYVGAAKAVRAVPLARSAITAAEGLGRGAVSRMALGTMAEAGFVEAGRIGLGVSGLPDMVYSGVTGRTAENRGAGDLLLEGAFNVGMAGLGGAAFGAIAGRLARQTSFSKISGLEETAPNQPLPVRIRAFNEFIRKAEDPADPFTAQPELLERVARERNNLMKFNLEGVVPKTSDNGVSVRSGTYRTELGRVFRPIIGEKAAKKGGRHGESSNWLERARRSQGGGGLTRTMRVLVDPKTGLESETALGRVLNNAGVSREEIAMETTDAFVLRVAQGTGKRVGQAAEVSELPAGAPASLDPLQAAGRRLQTSTPAFNKRGATNPNLSRAISVQRNMTSTKRGFQKIGNGWHLAREAGDDGLFVMTKKVNGGIEPAPGDEWMVVRTDNPGAFDPQSAALQQRMLRSGYFPEEIEGSKIGVGLWDADSDFHSMVKNNMTGQTQKAPKGGRIGQAISEVVDFAGDYVSPSAPGAARNELANQLFQRIKGAEAWVEKRVDGLMRGDRLLDPSKSMGAQVLSFKEVASEGIDGMARALDADQVKQFAEVLRMETPADMLPDLLARGVIDEPVHDLLLVLQKYSDDTLKQVETLHVNVQNARADKLTGDLKARKGHYGITRERPGAYRQFLNDEAGEIVGEVAADNPLDLKIRLDEVIEDQASRTGRQLYPGAFVDTVLRDAGEITKYQAAIRKPGFINARGNLLGSALEGKKDLTGADISRLIERNIKRRENFIRDIVLLEKLNPGLAQLDREAPSMAQFVRKRMQLLAGDEGEWGRAQNQIMDKALAVVGLSGKNSASAIVRETQKILSDFQFGFANIVNPLQNLTGMFQTILPEVSFATRVNAASAHNYVSLPVFDGQNNVVGSVNMLSDVKLFYSAMRNAGKNFGDLEPAHQELIYTMMQERQLAPRFAEEQFGLNGALLADPAKALKSPGEFVEFLGAANRVMVTKSEEFNRIIAVNAAYEVAKLRGMNQAQMTLFTREFLARTAFNYGTVDRATVFTTPTGALLGTFKNWMFHYTANMIKYAGGGKETLPALLWQTGSTALLGGAAATPFIKPLADGASKFLTDKGLMENLYAGFGEDKENLADGILYGLPGMLGVSFSSQVSSPGADPERDATMMFSLAMSDRMRSLSSATKDAIAAYTVTGESPFTDDRVRDQMIRALAPRSVFRAMAAGENGAIRSMSSGNDVIRLGPGSAALYAMGFNPTELDKTYEVYEQVRGSSQKKKALTQEFGKTLAQAWADGDAVLANRVFARATAVGVDTSSVLRSAKAIGEKREVTQLEAAATPQDQIDYSFMFD